MEEAVGEHNFDVAKKVGSATYLPIFGLEDHITLLHEADFIQKAHTFLSSIGGSVTHEDAFHINYSEGIDESQFEEK